MKYGFIGCGNMGGSIAKALSNSTKDILLADPTEKAAILAQQLGCACADNETVVSTCDCVFLAVKPQVMADVLAPLRPCFEKSKPLVVSMAAGITVEKIESLIGTSLPVIRIMPNTPVAVGAGMILYCHNALVDEAMLEAFLKDAAPCGQWDLLEEALIDAAGVVSGCGPAYMYMFMDALADGAVACGVPKEKALMYAAATMIGAAKMVQNDGRTPVELKNAVCSPGGSTLAGVKVFDDNSFDKIVMDCVKAAYKRNQELGK
ncbi:MAG: pyrroline-5-carboxylate reductase [Ruminococcaceae bacterium]|nr:pyrroline-5-carboxylate reductase [Oscillospiraceae bacterium]